MERRLTSLGEILFDFLPVESGGEVTGFSMHPGGGPYNVAVGMARLGQPTAFVSKVGDDFFGRRLRRAVRDEATGAIIFCDCSPESPAGRRSLCYDRAALDGRKENKPASNAVEMAAAIGVELLSEAQYRALQELGEFDRKTSSWVITPAGIRERGGAIFCDRRYDHVFTYHNGADSYYGSRGFRGRLTV